MKGTNWGWRPPRAEGIWKYGCKWAQPFTAAAPWLTLVLLFLIFYLIEGRLTAGPGLLFDLPATFDTVPAAVPGLAAVVVPAQREGTAAHETLIFFDDGRYSMQDATSLAQFSARLAQRADADEPVELLLMADVRVPTGDLMKLASLARAAGVKRVQIAEKRE